MIVSVELVTLSQLADLSVGNEAVTAVLRNFLRVNAQMYNLDKQKTVPRRNPLAVRLNRQHDNA